MFTTYNYLQMHDVHCAELVCVTRLADQLLHLQMLSATYNMCKKTWEDRQLHLGSGDIVQTGSDT